MCGHSSSLQKPVVDLTHDQFHARFVSLLDKAGSVGIRRSAFFWVPANQPPWFDTGIDVSAGEEISVITAGRAILSRELALSFHPDIQLWFRVGTLGEVFRGTRNTHSFRADAGGRLYLGNYFPGQWSTHTGSTFVGTEAFRQMEGGVSVLVMRWKGPALTGLRQLKERGDVESLLASEIERLENPVLPPTGWSYLWFLGASEIFSASPPSAAADRVISCSTHRDAAIIHKDVSMPLQAGTTLRWAWKVDKLPCDAPEDALQNHDYLSIAVEFDNGQDLTFLWSSRLAVDTGFRCPIPSWTAREMHVVARSGEQGLGTWCIEERDLFDYYERFIGTIGAPDLIPDARVVAPPSRVVRVWLIANSMFREGTGKCEYGKIELRSGSTVIEVN